MSDHARTSFVAQMLGVLAKELDEGAPKVMIGDELGLAVESHRCCRFQHATVNDPTCFGRLKETFTGATY